MVQAHFHYKLEVLIQPLSPHHDHGQDDVHSEHLHQAIHHAQHNQAKETDTLILQAGVDTLNAVEDHDLQPNNGHDGQGYHLYNNGQHFLHTFILQAAASHHVVVTAVSNICGHYLTPQNHNIISQDGCHPHNEH
jgi:hypothetical protein